MLGASSHGISTSLLHTNHPYRMPAIGCMHCAAEDSDRVSTWWPCVRTATDCAISGDAAANTIMPRMPSTNDNANRPEARGTGM